MTRRDQEKNQKRGLRYPSSKEYELIPSCFVFHLLFQQARENVQEEWPLTELSSFFTEPRMDRFTSQMLKMVLQR